MERAESTNGTQNHEETKTKSYSIIFLFILTVALRAISHSTMPKVGGTQGEKNLYGRGYPSRLEDDTQQLSQSLNGKTPLNKFITA